MYLFKESPLIFVLEEDVIDVPRMGDGFVVQDLEERLGVDITPLALLAQKLPGRADGDHRRPDRFLDLPWLPAQVTSRSPNQVLVSQKELRLVQERIDELFLELLEPLLVISADQVLDLLGHDTWRHHQPTHVHINGSAIGMQEGKG